MTSTSEIESSKKGYRIAAGSAAILQER